MLGRFVLPERKKPILPSSGCSNQGERDGDPEVDGPRLKCPMPSIGGGVVPRGASANGADVVA
jgi:hypothetical protein